LPCQNKCVPLHCGFDMESPYIEPGKFLLFRKKSSEKLNFLRIAQYNIYNLFEMIYNISDNTMEKVLFRGFQWSVFAGICIGIAGMGFLTAKPIGMFLFIFGLATVVKYGLKLFTGTAGFVTSWKDLGFLLLYLIGNLAGCALVASMVRLSGNGAAIQESAIALLDARNNLGIIPCAVQAIGCGILMTTAVTFAKKGDEFGNWVPLLFAVPLFIHCGFPHCIADAFYYMCVPTETLFSGMSHTLPLYLMIVLGNFIGCNLYRFLGFSA